MAHLKLHPAPIETSRYTTLSLVPPLVDVILRATTITTREFARIVQAATNYENDPRMVEMVRLAGDASAKVPYLLADGETPDSILAALRDIARPHVTHLQRLPDPLRATIELLLSINAVPAGHAAYGLPALLEIHRMQGAIVGALREMMRGRRLAQDFHADNHGALAQLDEAWPRLRAARHRQDETRFRPLAEPALEQARMQYLPFFDPAGRLLAMSEACALMPAPDAGLLRQFTPAVLQRPLPEAVPVPAVGSADWLIREIGKVGRHFTRALLDIIQQRLAAERVSLEARNYAAICQHAQEALQEYVADTP